MCGNTASFGPPLRDAIHPCQISPPLKAPPPLQQETKVLEDGKTFYEKDLAIPMRDGVTLYGDLYRPIDELEAKTPTIVLFSPFGKHGALPVNMMENMDVDFSALSEHTHWELPDPLDWCANHRYSLLIVDARGTWWSEGEVAYFFSPEEGRDGYDIVEWVARQPWNTGRVGWGAVSYYAMSAYHTAALNPPHLSAILLWEAMSDIYREVNVVGGIPGAAMQQLWMLLTGNGLGKSEDHATMALEQPLYSPLWASKKADWTQIKVPAFSVTGWSSLSLHLRGTINAWKALSSQQKYLWVHAGKEWSMYYGREGQRRQKAFWDRYLKDQPTEVDDWPAVELEIRYGIGKFITRSEVSWPPKDAHLTEFRIASDNSIEVASVISSNTVSQYASYVSHKKGSHVKFDYTFSSRTEITGDASVRLFIQAIAFPDTDLYVAVKKLDKAGKEIKFPNSSQLVEASAAHGWLRVSHREKDDEESRPGRPVHRHQRYHWLRSSDIVEVEVELWPSSTIWEEGETMRLQVQGHTFFADEGPQTNRNASSHCYGEVRVWFGGQYPSSLFLPVVKAERARPYPDYDTGTVATTTN